MSQRIVILGCAGTGKSTYARSLGLPIVILDEVWPQPLVPDDVPEFRALVTELHAGDVWISDGNYAAASFDLRLPRATQILWFESPRLVCLWRTLKRALTLGTDHRLRDWPQVAKFIWSFDRVNRPRIEALIKEHGPHLEVIHTTSTEATQTALSGYQESE